MFSFLLSIKLTPPEYFFKFKFCSFQAQLLVLMDALRGYLPDQVKIGRVENKQMTNRGMDMMNTIFCVNDGICHMKDGIRHLNDGCIHEQWLTSFIVILLSFIVHVNDSSHSLPTFATSPSIPCLLRFQAIVLCRFLRSRKNSSKIIHYLTICSK